MLCVSFRFLHMLKRWYWSKNLFWDFFIRIRLTVGVTNVELESHVLSEHRIQLFRYVIVFVADFFRSQLQYYVWVGLAVDVHRMEVIGFHDVHPYQHVDGIVRGQTLKEPVLRVEPHYGVVVDVFRQREFVHFYRTLRNTINGIITMVL